MNAKQTTTGSRAPAPRPAPALRRAPAFGPVFVRPALLLLQAAVLLLGSCAAPADTTAPVFEGLRDITVYAGEGVAYRQGVTCRDNVDGEIDYTVDAGRVDLFTPGTYTAVYMAEDAAGNRTEQAVRVTVRRRPVSQEVLHSLVDPVIWERGLRGADMSAVCEDLYFYIKAVMTYSGDSDKSDWTAEAYRGLTAGQGDCFTYYAVARAFFDRLGYEYLTVQRSPGALPSTHYWFLINTGTAESPAWYHWDCCPHDTEYPLNACLITDAQLLDYNSRVPGYYAFDMDSYPRTPD